MKLALELAGLKTVPEGSAIHHPEERIANILAGIDITVSALVLGKDLAFHLAWPLTLWGGVILNC
jgi:hypothetical protein